MIYAKGEYINESYVVLPLHKGHTSELYRVRSPEGELSLLKLFRPDLLSPHEFTTLGRVRELELLEQLRAEGIIAFKRSGTVVKDGGRYPYALLEYIPGNSLEAYLSVESFSLYSEVVDFAIHLLQSLRTLHLHYDSLVLNGLNLESIFIDARGEELRPVLIDLGHTLSTQLTHQGCQILKLSTLNLAYVANECFNQAYSIKSDLYSLAVVLYRLIYGRLPWTICSDAPAGSKEEQELWREARRHRLTFPEEGKELIGYEERIELILKKALSNDLEDRFSSADEFIAALRGEVDVEDVDSLRQEESAPTGKPLPRPMCPAGKGFAAVAGLTELKQLLQRDVIEALRQPEKYAQYGLSIPNGMLLYGPPGCGKTFFAKRFAEEVGFNFMCLTPSTLKSRYVNATQENIAKMFEEAAQNAPTIVFIDEINELVPNRESDVHEMSRSAVNEMLAQMDRTGERGIFVIGATNYPHQIDPAMLRAGRLERKVYLPPPDQEVRVELFMMYLQSRPFELGIDYAELANLTEGYVSADIELLVNDAARMALGTDSLIGMPHLKQAVQARKPSLSPQEIARYEEIRCSVEQEKQETSPRRIGYK
jgi:hypothetical protein